MNNRQKEAQRHARELSRAKRDLIDKVNQQIQTAKARGYEPDVAPQLLRLLGTKQYRKRDINRMNDLISRPDELAKYIPVLDTERGIYISGGESLERYAKYQHSGIYRDVSYELPTEIERTLTNFSESVSEAFPDSSAFDRFMNYLDRAIEQDVTIADDGYWKLLHQSIDLRKSGNAKSEKEIQSSKQFWIWNNRDNIREVERAVDRIISVEGVESLVRRISDNAEEVIESLIVAAIGYKEDSARAMQTVLNTLLPNSVRNRAMAMGGLPDADDFNNEELE